MYEGKCLLTLLQALDCDRRGVVPEPLPDLPKLSVPKLPHELEAGSVDLPLIPGAVRQTLSYGFLLGLKKEMGQSYLKIS